MKKITFVSIGIINDMFDRLYEWYNSSRDSNGIPKYDIKYVACATVAANPKTSLITYKEKTNSNDVVMLVPTENDTTENVQKQYKHCIHVLYEEND